MTKPNKKDLDAVGKKISKISKEEINSIKKAKISRMKLSNRQKKQARLIKNKIAGMSKKEKLKAMTPKGVQKLMDDAAAELKEMEDEE